MTRKLMLVALVALVLPGCGNLLQPAAATVNGEKITIHEIEKELDAYQDSDEFREAAQQGDPQALRRLFEQQELSRRILIEVLEPEAEDLGLAVGDEDVDEEIQRVIEEDYNGSDAAFEEALKERGIPRNEIDDIAYLRLLERRVKNAVTEELTPSDEEMRAFYDDNAENFVETEASEIQLPSQGDAARVARELQRTPEGDLLQRFAEVAREESLNSETAVAGGALVLPFRPGDIDPAFEAAASRLEPGEVSGPVRTDKGWEVILVRDRRPIPYEEVRDEIIEALAGEERNQVWDEWLRDAYETADVEVNPRFGEFDLASLQVVDAPTSDLPGTAEVTPTPPGG